MPRLYNWRDMTPSIPPEAGSFPQSDTKGRMFIHYVSVGFGEGKRGGKEHL